MVLKDIQRIPKSGRNKFHGYDYATEGDLVDHIRPKLAEVGVFLFTSIETVGSPEVVERKNSDGRIVTIATIHTFVDAETGESYAVKGAGCGEDSGDKALYKAITGAEKYMLMKNFLVATGDDPEADSPAAKPVNLAPKPVEEKPDIRFIGIMEESKKKNEEGKEYMAYRVKEGAKEYEASCWDAALCLIISAARESGCRVKATVKTKGDKVKIVMAETETGTYEIKQPTVKPAILKGAEDKVAELLSGGK